MKKFLAVIMCVVMVLGALPVFAGETAQAEEAADGLTEQEQTNKAVSIVIMVGAVIGALLLITLLYKKKDELRYL